MTEVKGYTVSGEHYTDHAIANSFRNGAKVLSEGVEL